MHVLIVQNKTYQASLIHCCCVGVLQPFDTFEVFSGAVYRKIIQGSIIGKPSCPVHSVSVHFEGFPS